MRDGKLAIYCSIAVFPGKLVETHGLPLFSAARCSPPLNFEKAQPGETARQQGQPIRRGRSAASISMARRTFGSMTGDLGQTA